MNIIAVVQARTGSKRLPNKVLKKIKDKYIIEILLERLSNSILIDKVVVAIPDNKENEKLDHILKKFKINIFRGCEDDVLDRYYNAALSYKADVVIRITGDCPLIDFEIVDNIITEFLDSKYDYVSNTLIPTYPDGLDVEVFSFQSLRKAWMEANSKYDREHVTPYIKNNLSFSKKNILYSSDLSKERWTLDEREDFELIQNIFDHFYPNILFTMNDIIKLKINNLIDFSINQNFSRNEGSKMDEGKKIWQRAKKIIPGGNMLLSKRPEMFCPDNWPPYYSKAKGCKIWDLNSNCYTDMAYMGVGTNILGYCNRKIDLEVIKNIQNSNMSSLNNPKEVYLAEKLIEMHPWSEMVKFARTGAEANSIAIRIARAASGRQNIAMCGYHGWHDWYLSTNLNKKDNLKNHLLSGLDTKGVSFNLKNTVFPFAYNNFKELIEIVKTKNIGTIIMEVERNEKPKNNFLQNIRKLASKENIVLIFDECTSGFRKNFGGLHLVYEVEPDIAMFGKALGNGYAINAVIGRKQIMQEAQSSFISSTFWTEGIGPAAALKVLEIMSLEKSFKSIDEKGKIIRQGWDYLSDKYKIPIKHRGLDALCGFDILLDNSDKYKALITQEMLKKGWLASNTVYVCTKHSKSIINNYIDELDFIFKLIYKCENGLNVNDLINFKLPHKGFSRLN